jgi:hypothetical protein
MIERLERKYPDFDAGHFACRIQAIRDDEHKLIVTGGDDRDPEDGDRGCELYAWREDPLETTDLAVEQPAIADRLATTLRDHLQPLDGPGEFETPDDPGLEAQLRDLGYL